MAAGMRKGMHRDAREKTTRLDRYAGEWIMLVGSKVVAHDRSLAGAILQASRMSLRSKPTVFLVPHKDEGPYLLYGAGQPR